MMINGKWLFMIKAFRVIIIASLEGKSFFVLTFEKSLLQKVDVWSLKSWADYSGF